MRNLFKKSLAFCLVAALALTCFVGTFSVSAATFNATISVDNQTITQGTTSVPVVLNITSSEAGINEALIKVSSTLGTVTDVALDLDDSVATIQYPEGATDLGSFFLSATNVADGDTTALGSIAAASITVTFEVAADVAVGDYTIAIDTEGVVAASAAEDVINFVYTPATITVAAGSTECVHTYDAEDAINYVNFTATGIEYYEVCTACGENVVVSTDESETAVAVAGKALAQAYYSAINVTAAGTYSIPVDAAQSANLRYAFVKDDKLIANGYHSSLVDGDASNGENAFTATYADGVVTVTADFSGIFVAFVPANVSKLPTANIGMTSAFDLGSSIGILFKVNKTNLANFTECYAVINHDKYQENTLLPKEDVIINEYKLDGNYYTFTYNIAAAQMGDTVTATYYGVLDGVDYTLRQKPDYNLVAYAAQTNNIGYKGTDNALKTLLSTIFEYGAIAQTHFGYHTEALVTSNELITGYLAEFPAAETVAKEDVTYVQGVTTHLDSAAKKFGVAKGLNCESTVEVYFRMNVTNFIAAYGADELANIDFKIYYKEPSTTETDVEFTVETLKITDAYKVEGNYYYFKADKIVASMMASATMIEANYNGDALVTSTHSINQYLFENFDGSTTLNQICRAIATYGTVAREYFGIVS